MIYLVINYLLRFMNWKLKFKENPGTDIFFYFYNGYKALNLWIGNIVMDYNVIWHSYTFTGKITVITRSCELRHFYHNIQSIVLLLKKLVNHKIKNVIQFSIYIFIVSFFSTTVSLYGHIIIIIITSFNKRITKYVVILIMSQPWSISINFG